MTILVAEDNPAEVNSLLDALEAQGRTDVLVAHDRDAAARIFDQDKDERIGVVLVDWHLPGEDDGPWLARRIRQAHRATPAYMIMISGNPHHAREAIELGADDFLPKMYLDDLLEACL